MKGKYLIGNEDGSVLVIALVMLALLVILGISATTTSNIETLVTRNIEEYTDALYRAEAAAMEGTQMLQNANPNPRDDPSFSNMWLNQTVGDLAVGNILEENYWDDVNNHAGSGGIANTELLGGSEGIVSGSSLDMGKSKVYGYTVYGRCELPPPTRALVIIGVGYRRAF
jgi:hypothetical protein